MTTYILKILTFIIFILIFLLLYIKYIEKTSIFFPIKELTQTPANINLPFEDVYLTTSDNIKIHSWFIPNKNAKYTILFCHGNAGNISHRLEKINLFYSLGFNTFIFDYRGYDTLGETTVIFTAGIAVLLLLKRRKI